MQVTKIPKKTITILEPKRSLIVDKGKYRQQRVAAYCRVSTDSEEQLTSYTTQKKVYTEMIAARTDWEFAGLYADAADIIGLNQKPEANGRRFSPFSLVSAHFKANGGCNCLI